MKGIKEDIKELLLKNENYRDSDEKLIAAYYYNYHLRKDEYTAQTKTALEFLKDLANGKFPSPDTITRVRRKLQEQDENLRGKKYVKRHDLESETRKEIKNL